MNIIIFLWIIVPKGVIEKNGFQLTIFIAGIKCLNLESWKELLSFVVNSCAVETLDLLALFFYWTSFESSPWLGWRNFSNTVASSGWMPGWLSESNNQSTLIWLHNFGSLSRYDLIWSQAFFLRSFCSWAWRSSLGVPWYWLVQTFSCRRSSSESSFFIW